MITKEELLIKMKEKQVVPCFDKELMKLLDIPNNADELEQLQSILRELADEGKLILTKKLKYGLPEQLGLTVGRLQGNAKGFGFLIPDDNTLEDIYITVDNMNGAMHNDRIIVRMLKKDINDKRSREGEVFSILSHTTKKVVGTFEESRNFGFVTPDDGRIFQDIFIPQKECNGAKTGFKVVAEIVKWPEARRNPEGKIIEILGHKDDVGTDIVSIIRQYDLPEEFSEEVLQAAHKVPESLSEEEVKGREDLRDKRIVTIDGDDAKDLDDAVSIEILPNGNFFLGVHIADVSYYVKEGSVLDQEALKRGTSVYLVDRVVPMLPKELSNGICSLNPKVDRLTLSMLMEIDANGKVVSHRFSETIIKTSERMTYENVTKILEGSDPEITQRYAYLVEDFKAMERLCHILQDRRAERGSIDFDLDEAKILLDIKGKPIDIFRYERGISNRVIEEFMLVCNETVAEHMFWTKTPFVYRVHEEPDTEKLLDFNNFIHNFGYQLKGVSGKVHPKTLQTLLIQIQGTREETIISRLMLRSLQKARYSHRNLGHFGLAAEYYCHFTSPIRRYPDLIIHRIIREFLQNKITGKRLEKLEKNIPGIADQCSLRERTAMEAERATDDLKKTEFMRDKVGNEYDGIISGVTSFGFYVELDNTVEGLVRVNTLDDDYYVFDDKHYCMIGEHTRKVYRLGDTVRIKVTNADIVSRKIDFVVADNS